MIPPQISAESAEYIHVPVTADVTLDSQPVAMAFTSGPPDDATEWTAAQWAGDPGTTRTARILIGPGTGSALAPGLWAVWVKITDSPEIPVKQAGHIKIV